jgi:hypothetical protein
MGFARLPGPACDDRRDGCATKTLFWVNLQPKILQAAV